MSYAEIQPYVVPAAFVGFFALRALRARRARARIPELLARGGVIVDVRTPGEFAAGANPQSVNLPLNQLGTRFKELDPSKPVIVCCASGTRSALAARILKRHGFKEVVNAGSWGGTLR